MNDTASTTALAGAIRCSGGVFGAQWSGDVVVRLTFEVANETVLHVAGVGSVPEMQAASGIRPFIVRNTSLEMGTMKIAGGYATFGGAIAAAASVISLRNTSSVGNGAGFEGGPIHATAASIASIGDGSLFNGNHAGVKGGALHSGGGSSATFHGYASFNNCTTDSDVGALSVSSSNVSWSGEIAFSENAANGHGGAPSIFSSDVPWSGDAMFFENTAGGYGGALDVWDSSVSWLDDVIFLQQHRSRVGRCPFHLVFRCVLLG